VTNLPVDVTLIRRNAALAFARQLNNKITTHAVVNATTRTGKRAGISYGLITLTEPLINVIRKSKVPRRFKNTGVGQYLVSNAHLIRLRLQAQHPEIRRMYFLQGFAGACSDKLRATRQLVVRKLVASCAIRYPSLSVDT
jgi:hypothetical protein